MRVRVAGEFVPLLVGIRGVADISQRARNGRVMVLTTTLPSTQHSP